MSSTSQRVKQAYHHWADIYDSNENKTRDLNARILRESDLFIQDQRILELGCGTGLNTEYLSQAAREVVAVDFSNAMLTKARQRVKSDSVRFVEADITRDWPFVRSPFDLVVINLVLEHIEELDPIFCNVSQSLTDGGYLYLAELHPYKQYQQSQARFDHPEIGKQVKVDAFVHPISEYVNTALRKDFRLVKMRESRHPNDEYPRLLSLLFQKT
jgi:SAM-dependent methyltransferase